MLLKSILEQKIPITIVKKCQCGIDQKYQIPIINTTSSVEMEYRFAYNNSTKIADVAYLYNMILIIFE